MRPVFYVATFIAVIALAFWAYRENYATQQALNEMTALQDEIAGLNEALAVQRAEWAYLNRPDRLQELAALNFDRLGLFPLEPDQLQPVRRVAYPLPPESLVIESPTDIVGDTGGDIKTAPADAEAFP